jgi:2-polyprenyl-3-methyl-5-hydroxy-6-metoxy-1,4-benzoquinol methylase
MMNRFRAELRTYLGFGADWRHLCRKDRHLRRLLGVTSIHTRLRSLHVMGVIEALSPFPDSVMEVGFGEGHLLSSLAQRHLQSGFVGWEADASHSIAFSALAKARGLTNVVLRHEDFREVSPKAEFNLIYCVDVLEHVSDDQGLLIFLAQCLLPGGRLLIHVPKRRSLQRRFFRRFTRHHEPGHVREEYTFEQLAAIVAATGLRIVGCTETFGPAGELAFELNSLGWPHRYVDKMVRAITLPVVLPLGLIDLYRSKPWGNSLLLMAGKMD